MGSLTSQSGFVRLAYTMRSRHLLLPVLIAASGTWLSAQAPPPRPQSQSKQKAPAPAPEPPPNADTDSAKKADTDPTAVTPEDPNADKSPSTADGSIDRGADQLNLNAGPDYTGPSILSRSNSFNPTAALNGERFRPYAGVNLAYDSGYTGNALPGNTRQLFGTDLNYGLTGRKLRRREQFSIDYQGHTYIFGTTSQDHTLNASYGRILSSRLTMAIGESAGLYSNTYGLINASPLTGFNAATSPLILNPSSEPFNDRTYNSTTQVDLAYRKSARLSFNMGAAGFVVKRATKGLASANGYQMHFDAAYRITRRTTIGPYYSYSRYVYTGTFGDAGVHTAGFNYSVNIARHTRLQARFGDSRVEARGLQNVTLDPAVAAILGYNSGIARFYAVTNVPDYGFDLTRGFQHSTLSLSYSKGVSPGNGIIQTSRHEDESVIYSYSGIRRYSFTLSGGRDYLANVGLGGNFGSYFGRFSASRALPDHLQALFSVDYRKLSYVGPGYNNNQIRVSVGVSYAPGFGPLKFW